MLESDQHSSFGRYLVLFVGATIVSGCIGGGPTTSDPQPDFPQAPVLETDTVSVFFEGDEDDNYGDPLSDSGTVEQGLVGDRARSLEPLKVGLTLANRMMLPAVAYLGAVMRNNDPVLQDEERFVWEVTRNGVTTTLVVTLADTEANTWVYQLSMRRAGSQEDTGRTLIMGFFEEGGRAQNGRQTGIGQMRVNYDALAPFVQPSERSSGIASFGFRTGPESKQLTMHFESFIPPRSEDVINGRFQYTQRDGGISEYRYILMDDYITWLQGDEVWAATTRWTPERAGRSRAVLRSPTNPEISLELHECFDPEFRQTWTLWQPAVPDGEANDGSPADCPSALRGNPPTLPDDRPVEAGDDAAVPGE